MNESAFIDGEPVTLWREGGKVYAAFDPWVNWGEGATVEEALDDLIDAAREMQTGPWERPR